MKQYLVAGGAGSIGSLLVHHLTVFGCQVPALDAPSTGSTDLLMIFACSDAKAQVLCGVS
jgi:hypothetical protein